MIELNDRGQNIALKGHVLSEETMRDNGFTDNDPNKWYLLAPLSNDITLNISIDKQTEELMIDVLDEAFLQPYDYQAMIARGNPPELAPVIQAYVEDYLSDLQSEGIISGFERGMYV